MATGSPVFHWAGSGGFAEALLPLGVSNLLLLAKQVRERRFFPKKLSETAAAASSAVLNLRGTLAFSSCWAADGIILCWFILCHLPKEGDQGCKAPPGV